MPRYQKSRTNVKGSSIPNPLHQDLLTKVMNAACQVEKIENTKSSDVARLMADPDYPTNKEYLRDIVANVTTTFQIDHSLTPITNLINVNPFIDKHKVNRLPPYTDKTVVRVVLVTGSHEVFYCSKMSSLPFKQGIFVPIGNGFKITPSHGDFTYDDRGEYDRSKYPGRGIKRPHERRLIVIDYVGETAAHVQDASAKEMSRSGEKLMKETAGSGLIQNLLKGLGMKKEEIVESQ